MVGCLEEMPILDENSTDYSVYPGWSSIRETIEQQWSCYYKLCIKPPTDMQGTMSGSETGTCLAHIRRRFGTRIYIYIYTWNTWEDHVLRGPKRTLCTTMVIDEGSKIVLVQGSRVGFEKFRS